MVEVETMKETGTRAKQGVVLRTEALTVTTGTCDLFVPISVSIPVHQVFGILGPSGAGKSTFLKCLNRLIDLTPNLRVKGDVFDLRQRH